MEKRTLKREPQTIREKADYIAALAEVFEHVEDRLNRWYLKEVVVDEENSIVRYEMPEEPSDYELSHIKAYKATLEAIKDLAEL